MAVISSRLCPTCGRPEEQPPRVISTAGLVINDSRRLVTVQGQPVALTHKQYGLLLALASRPGKSLSYLQLHYLVWGRDEDDYRTWDRRVIHVMISSLRRKLGDAGRRIEVVRGHGYRFTACEQKVA